MYKKSIKGWIKHLDFIILDMIAIEVAFLLAFTLRHHMDFWYTVRGIFDPHIIAFYVKNKTTQIANFYRDVAVALGFASIIADVMFENLNNVLRRGFLKELWAVIKMMIVVTLELLVILYIVHFSQALPRLLLGYFVIFSIICLYVYRIIYKTIIRVALKKRKYHRRRMVVYTTRADAKQVLSDLKFDAISDVWVSGIIGDDPALKAGEKITDEDGTMEVPVLAQGDDIIPYLTKNWVDEIFFATPRQVDPASETNRKGREKYDEDVNELITSCQIMGITTHREIYIQEHSGKQIVENLMGRTVLTESLKITGSAGYYLKRLFDIIGALIGLAITGILTVFVAIPGILKNDPGPIFFGQKRIGKNGRIFKLYKFRSMYQDAERRKAELMDQNKMQGLMFKMDADPRIIGSGPDGTRHGYGWFIRKTSIDEFPQFFNVLKGEMSLVGTRPPTVDEWDNYEAHHRARMAIRPGITGLWQVSGRSDITDFEEVIRLDLEYINNWSLGYDFKILFATIKAVAHSKGAE
ncbi:MAG: sugar transferase [bacterium LCO1.1]|uniref:Sugar transferase n=1 Tax=Candidatus Weimeria bifida TaxID=2599074 RepID=A0A6N7J240_9FIRM|nr:sugar transferase [Candidatus Weimeria bifida]